MALFYILEDLLFITVFILHFPLAGVTFRFQDNPRGQGEHLVSREANKLSGK